MSSGPQLGAAFHAENLIPAISLLWNQTNMNCAIRSTNDWPCPTMHIHLFAALCVCVWSVNNVHYSILLQNKEHYMLSHQHFPPENQSFPGCFLFSSDSPKSLWSCFSPVKEKMSCLSETTVLSTSTASGLWKSGCPWVTVTNTLSAGYLHLHIHEYMDYGCKLVTILLYATWLMLLTLAEALSFMLTKLINPLYIMCACVCVFVQFFLPCCYFSLLIIQAFQTALYRINPSPFIWCW